MHEMQIRLQPALGLIVLWVAAASCGGAVYLATTQSTNTAIEGSITVIAAVVGTLIGATCGCLVAGAGLLVLLPLAIRGVRRRAQQLSTLGGCLIGAVGVAALYRFVIVGPRLDELLLPLGVWSAAGVALLVAVLAAKPVGVRT